MIKTYLLNWFCSIFLGGGGLNRNVIKKKWGGRRHKGGIFWKCAQQGDSHFLQRWMWLPPWCVQCPPGWAGPQWEGSRGPAGRETGDTTWVGGHRPRVNITSGWMSGWTPRRERGWSHGFLYRPEINKENSKPYFIRSDDKTFIPTGLELGVSSSVSTS